MPIKFRCQHCRQFLGISRSKAGALTDCPTCGQTIRVPDLTGHVAPLPDAPLAAAVPASGSGWSPPPAVAEVDRSSAETIGVDPAEGAAAAPPVATPIAKPVAAPVARPLERSLVMPELPRAEVLPPSRSSHRPLRSAQVQLSPGVLVAACLGSLVVGLALGWAAGRSGQPVVVAPPSQPAVPQQQQQAAVPAVNAPAAAQPESVPEAPALKGEFNLTGSVRYENSGGNSQPDLGARVLILPLPRGSGPKLPAAGFRVNSSLTERQALETAAAQAGGGFSRADPKGNLSLPLPAAGRYALLIASRSQPRVSTAPVTNTVREFLDGAFDRPGQVLESVQFDYREITVAAGVPEEVKIYFTRN